MQTKKPIWKIYTPNEALITIKRVQIIDWKKFAKVVLDPNKEVFVVYIATIGSEMAIHLACKAQIASLKAEKTPVTVSTEYSDLINVFSEKIAIVLLEYTKINTHAINLEEGKQLLYSFIYSLKLVELETLKSYIKINLANDFIRPFVKLST